METNNNFIDILKNNDWASVREMLNDSEDKKRVRLIYWFFGIALLVMFIPWTQNIETTGTVTAYKPQDRPQDLNALIDGSIELWYVKEGDYVKKGDTILKLSEIKSEYLDPKLIDRTNQQLQAKADAVEYYTVKIQALNNQINALEQARDLKIEQLKNKILQANRYIESDSIAFTAADNYAQIAQKQYNRQKELYNQGLKSLTELEQKNQSLQDALAKKTVSENKLSNARNDWMNAKLELNTAQQDYAEKIAKANSEKYQALSQISNGDAEIAKIENTLSSYIIRNGFYFLTAPQSGQITKTIKAGLKETVKQGEMLVKITPATTEPIVEMYVSPVDLQLINIGEKVRLQFDGWPAVFFSGWEKISYGTFTGKIVAVDNYISDNGKFRILVSEDTTAANFWPKSLRIGGGAKGIIMLNNVFIGYEIWRKINGFPPNFYTPVNSYSKEKIENAPKKKK